MAELITQSRAVTAILLVVVLSNTLVSAERCKVLIYHTFSRLNDPCAVKFAYRNVNPEWINQIYFKESLKNATEAQMKELVNEVIYYTVQLLCKY